MTPSWFNVLALSGLVSGKNSAQQQVCEGTRLQIDSIVQLGLSSELCDLNEDIQGSSIPKKLQVRAIRQVCENI